MAVDGEGVDFAKLAAASKGLTGAEIEVRGRTATRVYCRSNCEFGNPDDVLSGVFDHALLCLSRCTQYVFYEVCQSTHAQLS